MKPAPFSYHRPGTREEVDGLLAELGPEAKLLAGGQSLIPILNMRLAAPEHLIDLNFLRDEPAEPVLDDGHAGVRPAGAPGRRRALAAGGRAAAADASRCWPTSPTRRSARAAPWWAASRTPTRPPSCPRCSCCSRARRACAGPRAGGRCAAGELFVSHLETTLEARRVDRGGPPAGARAGGAFEEFARRHGDYALCGVAALAADGDVALSFVGMGATPVRFVGDVATAVEQLEPEDDIHATAQYRRHLAEQLGERVARRAREAA